MMFRFLRKTENAMWLFAGLGNPGGEYAGNRHNIGFMAVQAIAEQYKAAAFRSKFKGHLSEVIIAGKKTAILMPKTFMNNSGESVAAAAKFFKIPPERIFVFYDELDLPPGKIRVKKGGGTGGHNGIRSIESHLGTADFWRVRMGIGHPGDKDKVSDYVLSDFAKADKQWVADLLAVVAKHCGLLVEGKDSEFMTRVVDDTKKG